ncbi:HalOD1 output domain-containing protein [Haloarcula sediminis]|uniref:HalOD1 output domain-containing protein n=1 Tax=Haloarcula sediminis TaxID=3111777 RepID=UPI002D794FAB|nr:HalOD1 output domain-containing protein [Haloarcula sp. CK38]
MEKRSPGTNGGRGGSERRISRDFNWNETPPSVAAVRLLSVAANADPTAIEPLGETVDPDTLDRLVPSMDGVSKVAFTHHGRAVVLYGDGTATVAPEDD